LDGEWISLLKLIQRDPEAILGKSAAEKFSNKLPFLFKVLAAAKPLSIQAHPNRGQAREGFQRENGLKISPDAPNRNYKDENHKPEIICALKPMWALKGFRKIEEIIALLDIIGAPALKNQLVYLKRQPDREGLKWFFTQMVIQEKERRSLLVNEVICGSEKYSGASPEFEWVNKLNREYPGNIGVLSPLFLRMVRLQPGEAMYTPAGELHSYLEGAGIELMASSDNVLRCGLTTKHMDAPELLKVLNFTTNETDILRPKRQESGESIYPTACEEFMLSVISLHGDSVFESPGKRGVEMMICIEGDFQVTDLGSGDPLSLVKGNSIVIPAGVERYRIEGEGTIYKASGPL
ncbi:MAG: mannose-6-phosphate isomerase, class I, partial [Desulfatiglandales bacterium]|nr:mannose-6-phosphate isomerase, class I [Desulfatiglandales bacterium]